MRDWGPPRWRTPASRHSARQGEASSSVLTNSFRKSRCLAKGARRRHTAASFKQCPQVPPAVSRHRAAAWRLHDQTFGCAIPAPPETGL